jgi:hypothetical protein
MGYTHYWYFHGDAAFSDSEWATLLEAMRELIKRYPHSHGITHGTKSARRTQGQGGGAAPQQPDRTDFFWIDGGCETFAIPKDPSMVLPICLAEESSSPTSTVLQQDESARFAFCKTNMLAYDSLVTAGLCIVWHLFPGKLTRIGSDGGAAEWREGLELARAALAALGHPGSPALPDL